jgi:4-hydroxy-4-methyl-2-oxoglutarate aldolase
MYIGDNLMLHAAMYEAPPGSVVVVQSGDLDFAAIGGNVARIAKERGVVALVLDGVVRDIAEIRSLEFPIFARGIVPVPGSKQRLGELNRTIVCGDVHVQPCDIIVADEEGIAVVPVADMARIHQLARKRQEKEESEGFETWKAQHRIRIAKALGKQSI